MIAKLTGQVDQTGEGYAVIDVNGIGYLVFCSSRTLNILATAIGAVSVIIETHVREDHIHLYGFVDEAEQVWFKLLITVQGVGAKVCLAILSALPPDNLVQAIAARDQIALCYMRSACRVLRMARGSKHTHRITCNVAVQRTT